VTVVMEVMIFGFVGFHNLQVFFFSKLNYLKFKLRAMKISSIQGRKITYLALDSVWKGGEKRLRWSRGSVLAFGTQVRGFKPGRNRRIFQGEKILSTPSSEVK
jgi:hypothetical protein